ncbi:MAG TPA: sulfotransferase family protein [Myxococcota bacterium]|nr:sulfotransferase family protein [Myxococcota bacterium]
MDRLEEITRRLRGVTRRDGGDTGAPVVVVSGAPRSGTSLMMQMLEAGGIAPLADDARPPDAGNPRGYYELEAVKRLPADAGWLARAPGRAVKVIHVLAPRLPEGPRYRVLWMERDLDEVVRSQRALLETLGRPPEDDLADARAAEILAQQLAEAAAALDARGDVRRIAVSHARLLAEPGPSVARIAAFLGVPLDLSAMAAAVDPALHRVRSEGASGRR